MASVRQAPRETPLLIWRLLSWAAGSFAALAFTIAVMNVRWDVTWRFTPTLIAGTRHGAVKVFKDWHTVPVQGWGVSRRVNDIDWAGRWLYDANSDWFEMPIWAALLLALIPSLILWHVGLKFSARLRSRRIAARALVGLSVLLVSAAVASVWLKAIIRQDLASLTVAHMSLTLKLDHSQGYVIIGGSPKAACERAILATPIVLPSWKDNGTEYALELPLWVPVIMLFAFAWGLRRLGRYDPRGLAGHCPSCGYDRKSLAQEATCPECGTRVFANPLPTSAPLSSPGNTSAASASNPPCPPDRFSNPPPGGPAPSSPSPSPQPGH